MKLGIDCMGSDLGSSIFFEPCKEFVETHDVDLYLYADEDFLNSFNHPRIHGVVSKEVMAMDDGPLAVRRKKDSSMVLAVTDLAEGKLDGVLSCGSTGALLSSGGLLVKTIEGIERAAILSLVPTATTPFAYLDMGANASTSPEQLVNFAKIGSLYMTLEQNITSPRVGLLNIGKEAHKGDDIRREAYQLLSQDESINFVGNIEGNQIFSGEIDVLVTDGFTGNIVEKAVEGTASYLMHEIKKVIGSSLKTKIGGLLLKNDLYKIKDLLNPNAFGGAMLIGLNGAIVKGHGNSNSEAVGNALKQLYTVCEKNLVQRIKDAVQ